MNLGNFAIFSVTRNGAITVYTERLRINRSSHRRCSLRKDVLKNFAKFTRKHLCQGLFLMKEDLKPATLLKRNCGTDVSL